ncbi:MAG: lantibiotic ABC transporter, partial [Chloroflexi bacterium]|nr:lantibiotic ABC transporter [Chloroflexota bacterium]
MANLADFEALKTHHCVTGSLRHVYVYHGCPVSEELLLGLGAGVGFVYWHTR